MALCRCPECGREGVSETARSCPNCGFDIRTFQRKTQRQTAAKKLWLKIEKSFHTTMGKVLSITFIIGFFLVCCAVYVIDESKTPEVLFIPAVYYVVAFLGISYFTKNIFDDAATVATIVCSPMSLFMVLFVIANNAGISSYTLLEWGMYGSVLISILIFEYKLIKALE